MTRPVRRRSWFVEHDRDLDAARLVVERGDEQRVDRDVAGARRASTGPTMPGGRHRLAPLRGPDGAGVVALDGVPAMRPGQPAGPAVVVLQRALDDPLLVREEERVRVERLERVLHADDDLVVLLQPVGDVEAERREVPLVVAEQLVVQPDVGEVVDRREAERGLAAGCSSGASIARVGELPAVPHGPEVGGELLVVPEVVGHDDLAPLARRRPAAPTGRRARSTMRPLPGGSVRIVGAPWPSRCGAAARSRAKSRGLGRPGRARVGARSAARQLHGATGCRGAVDRPDDERLRLEAGALLVRRQRSCAAQSSAWLRCTSATTHPPNPAPVSRAPIAPCSTSSSTSRSSSGVETCVVVAQAGVAGEQERAERVDVLVVERGDEVEDALVLGDDVARDRVVGAPGRRWRRAARRCRAAPRRPRTPARRSAYALPASVRATPGVHDEDRVGAGERRPA